MSSSPSEVFNKWWSSLSEEQRYLIYAGGLAFLVSAFVLDLLNDIDVTFWGGIALYGLVSMALGQTEIFVGSSPSEAVELFEIEIDPVVGQQVLAIGLAVWTVIFGQMTRSAIEGAVGPMSEVQILGLLIVLSRVIIVVWIQQQPIWHGCWSKSIYTLGGSMMIVPYLMPEITIVGSDISTILDLVVPIMLSCMIFRIEQEGASIEDFV